MRIRTIKPEFFDSPSTAASTPWARLLYIAMWCMADDWGVGSANLKELAANAFPNDDQWTSKELPSLCKEIADNFGVLFYSVRGRPFFEIPSWDDHQVTQRRAKRRNPTSDEAGATLDPRIHAEVQPFEQFGKELPSRDKENASTEQGKKEQGKKEQGNINTCSPATPSSERDPDRFEEFWTTYPRKVGKQKAKAKYAAATKRATQDDIIDGAHQLATDPNLPESQFIPHPTTWLERNGWEDEPLPARTDHLSSSQRRLMHAAQEAERFTAPPAPDDVFAAYLDSQPRKELT